MLGGWLGTKNSGLKYWFVYFAWGAIFMLSVTLLPTFALILLSIFFMRALFKLYLLMSLGIDLINILTPALEKTPNGLADKRLAYVLFDMARLDKIAPAKRSDALRNVAAVMFGPNGPASNWDCHSGHAGICAHRVSADAAIFWKDVAQR